MDSVRFSYKFRSKVFTSKHCTKVFNCSDNCVMDAICSEPRLNCISIIWNSQIANFLLFYFLVRLCRTTILIGTSYYTRRTKTMIPYLMFICRLLHTCSRFHHSSYFALSACNALQKSCSYILLFSIMDCSLWMMRLYQYNTLFPLQSIHIQRVLHQIYCFSYYHQYFLYQTTDHCSWYSYPISCSHFFDKHLNT